MEHIQQLQQNIHNLQRHIHKMKKSKMAQEHFLHDGERSIMKLIWRFNMKQGKNPSLVELSNLLGITQATVTPLVDRLIKKGLVLKEASPIDKRAKLLTLTDKGREILEANNMRDYKNLKDILDYLGDEDSEQLNHILAKVNHYLDNVKTTNTIHE